MEDFTPTMKLSQTIPQSQIDLERTISNVRALQIGLQAQTIIQLMNLIKHHSLKCLPKEFVAFLDHQKDQFAINCCLSAINQGFHDFVTCFQQLNL